MAPLFQNHRRATQGAAEALSKKTVIKKGQKLRLRYAILIHEGTHPISEIADALLVAR
jgi:hypothetical protein